MLATRLACIVLAFATRVHELSLYIRFLHDGDDRHELVFSLQRMVVAQLARLSCTLPVVGLVHDDCLANDSRKTVTKSSELLNRHVAFEHRLHAADDSVNVSFAHCRLAFEARLQHRLIARLAVECSLADHRHATSL